MEREPVPSEKFVPKNEIVANESSNSDLNLSYEIDRLKTFSNWTISDVNRDDLAAEGLYYVQPSNVIKCAFCDIKIVDFTRDALLGHKCSKNKEHDVTKSEVEDTPVTDKKENFDFDKDPASITDIEKSAREAWLDKIGIRGNIAPKFPHYSSLKDRLKSFSSWTSLNQQPSILSEAGFFYIGVEDRTACFHCGGGLREWKSTDDPFIEHAHWFPKCNFVLNVKGKEFIDQAWGKKLNIATPKEIKNAVDALKDLTDVINRKKSKAQKQTIVKCPDPKVTWDKEFTTCRICYEEERDVLFLPCHHLASCKKCATNLKECIICRAKINDVIRAIYA